MTARAKTAAVSAPGPKLGDWAASAALHVAAALALWQFAASVGPALPALQRIELPIRWAADPVVTDEQPKTVEAAAVAPPAPPTPRPAEPARSIEARPPAEARPPIERAPVRRRVVAAAPEAAMRVTSKSPAEAPAIAQPEAPTSAESASLAADAQPAPAVAASTAANAAAAAPLRPVAADPGARQRWHKHLERLMREHKHYPMQARRMRQQGVVTVEARFSADGELLRCDVAGSSGFRSLDEAALKLVRAAAEALRAHHGPGELAELRIPIAYELSGS